MSPTMPSEVRLRMHKIDDLAAWLSDLGRAGPAALPERALRRAGAVLADDLAAMVAAEHEPEVRRVADVAASRGAGTEARIVCSAASAQRGWSALANAVATNWTELDEGYRPATCHGGLYSVPAAIAEVEATSGTIGQALTAIVAGYEVSTRVARAFAAPKPPSLHPHATLSPLGAAATVAAARGLDAEVTTHALSGAATLSMTGPFSHAAEGALIRNGWAGAGAWLGFTAVDLAAAALTGGTAAMSQVFQHAQGGQPRPKALTDGLGDTYAVEDGYHKLYACCQYTHAAVEAALRIRADGPIADAASVRVETHPLALALDNAAPSNTLAAKFSVPHTVASALVTGDPGPTTFGTDLLADPTVRALRERVEFAAYTPLPDPPHDRPARVTVIASDGTTRSAVVESPIGSPDRPLTDNLLLEKITDAAGSLYPALAAELSTLIAGHADLDEPLSDVLNRALARKA